MINVQLTLRTAPGLCKYVPLSVLFGSNGNSYTVSMQADLFYIYIYILFIHMYIYIYIHTYSSQYIGAVRVTEIKSWDSSKCRAPRKLLNVPFRAHMP